MTAAPAHALERRGASRLAWALGLTFVGRALKGVLNELDLLARHWRGVIGARRYREATNLKLHFACGAHIKLGWVNIDIDPRADLQLDLRKQLPFADGSCELTMSEHFFEHLDYPYDALHFLRECWRVTRPGGRISVGVPDAGMVMALYAQERAAGFAEPFVRRPWHPVWVEDWMGRVNFLFRQNRSYAHHEHRYAYDLPSLLRVLALAGFVDARQRAVDPELDSERRRDNTLYVEATRP